MENRKYFECDKICNDQIFTVTNHKTLHRPAFLNLKAPFDSVGHSLALPPIEG